jgi:asparagine synthase (glutamine-hydrolysing)
MVNVSPLVSQPLIELCLAIPTWFWCADGQNRAIARKAFAGDLPPPTLARRSRGTSESFILQALELN